MDFLQTIEYFIANEGPWAILFVSAVRFYHTQQQPKGRTNESRNEGAENQHKEPTQRHTTRHHPNVGNLEAHH